MSYEEEYKFRSQKDSVQMLLPILFMYLPYSFSRLQNSYSQNEVDTHSTYRTQWEVNKIIYTKWIASRRHSVHPKLSSTCIDVNKPQMLQKPDIAFVGENTFLNGEDASLSNLGHQTAYVMWWFCISRSSSGKQE